MESVQIPEEREGLTYIEDKLFTGKGAIDFTVSFGETYVKGLFSFANPIAPFEFWYARAIALNDLNNMKYGWSDARIFSALDISGTHAGVLGIADGYQQFANGDWNAGGRAVAGTGVMIGAAFSMAKIVTTKSAPVKTIKPKANASKGGLEVTEASIAKALEGSTMRTLQAKVSLPMVQRYVRMLEQHSVAPPIKVVNGIIVEGNHRYVAGRVFGVTPRQAPYVLSESQLNRIVPIQKTIVDPLDWGGH